MLNPIKKIQTVLYKLSYILTKKQKKKSIIVFGAILIGSLMEMIGVSSMIPLITAMLYPEKLWENPYIVRIFETFQIGKDFPIFIIIGIAVMLVYIIKNMYLIFLSYVRSEFAGDVQQELSGRMMKAFMDRDYIFFLNTNSSELLRGISEDVARVHTVLNNLFKMVTDLLTIFAICLFIICTDVLMALSVIALAGGSLVVISLLFRKRMKELGKERVRCETVLKQEAYQAFQGIKEITVMNRKQYFANRYSEGWRKQKKTVIGEAVASESPAYIIETVCVIGLMLAIFVRIGLGVEADSFFAQLAAFAVGAFKILPAVSKTTSTINLMNYYLPGVDAVYSNLNAVELYRKKEKRVVSKVQYTDFKKELEIRNVSWEYPGTNKMVLRNLSMKVKKGTSVGLIGESGAGKSTLADIILGLLRPEEGEILLDGINIKDLGTDWNAIVGYVPQTIYLIDDTVRKNVAFGMEDNKIDDGKVWKALEQAQLKEFVEELPNGLDTLVGERGVRFSGGQRQRIAIARALYENPKILVLDEATSALDNETEESVMESIEALQGYKTLIIVAHRLTTIQKCDAVYEIIGGSAVLKNKEI